MTAPDLAIARLRAAGLTVFDTIVPRASVVPYPYALVWAHQVPKRHDLNLAGTEGARWALGVTVAGITPGDVRATGQAVFNALHKWTPDPVDGWRFDECRHQPGQGQAVQEDGDMPPVNGAPVLFGVEFYEITATPLEGR